MTQANNGAAVATQDDIQHAVFESLTLKGDISNLNPQQKAVYLEKLCTSLGLNPLTQPFVPLKLSGKEVLYASRACTDQLAGAKRLTREIVKTETIGDVYVATCKVSDSSGRFDVSTGAVTIGNLKGDALANALMKAETKAKRRATLCFCGLGFLDESEIETIPANRVERIDQSRAEPTPEEKQRSEKLAVIQTVCKELNTADDSIKWSSKTLSEFANDYFNVENGLSSLSNENLDILIEELQGRVIAAQEAQAIATEA